MKKIILKIMTLAVIALFAASCATFQTATKESVKLPGLAVSRADYKLTSDMSAEAEIKIILGIFVKGADKNNVKVGKINAGGGATADESLAVFNLLEAHPEVDYLTNIRYLKTYTKKPFSKTYKTKVIAKGIILKTDK